MSMPQKNEMLHRLLDTAFFAIKNKSSCVLDKAKAFYNPPIDTVVASTAFTLGSDRDKVLAAELLLKEMYERNDVNLPSKLLEYPQHILTSLLSIFQRMSDWTPTNTENKNNYLNYQTYLSNLLISGVFSTHEKSEIKVEYKTGDYNALLKKVTDLYSYVSDEEYEKIYQSLKKVTQNALKKVQQDNTDIFFTPTVLSLRNSTMKLHLYSTKITVYFDPKTGRVKPHKEFISKIQLSRLALYFMDFKLSTSDVKKIINIDFTLLSEWRKQNNMVKEPNDYLLCID